MLTRESLLQMPEDQFRRDVLIPLFQAMGFLNVQLHHGGPLEQGKDIVMWKRDDIRSRVNYAVVAKSQPISGKASGAGSAAEVSTQLRQCFGRPFQDAVTLEERRVDRSIVACPYDIKKEAQHTIISDLDANMARNVDFFFGQQLWEAIETHLGSRTVVGKLHEVGRVLDDVSPHHRVIAQVRGDQVVLGVEAKHSGASEAEPLVFQGAFAFPDDEDGRSTMEALQRHIQTGSPVSIPSRFIKEWSPPELLRPFMNGPLESLAMAPLPSGRTLVVDLCCETPSGRTETSLGLRLREIQSGTDEVTFECNEAGCPYRVVLTANRIAHRFQVNLSIDITGLNVRSALEAIRVRNALSEGGRVFLRDSSSRLVVVAGDVAPGRVEATAVEFERFLEDLVLIQSVTRRPIEIPSRDFTEDDLSTARQVAQALREGVLRVRVSSVRVTLTPEGVRAMLDQAARPSDITMVDDEGARLCDVDVQLGRVVRVISGLEVLDRSALEEAVRLDRAEPIEVTLVAGNQDINASMTYVDHLPPEEQAKYSHLLGKP